MTLYSSDELGISYLKMPSVVSKAEGFRAEDCYQLQLNGEHYVLGEFALRHLNSWERPINATPESWVWRALFAQGLSLQPRTDFSVVVGAPKFLANQRFKELIKPGPIEITLPNGVRRTKIIHDIKVVPECAGHAIAFRKIKGFAALVCSLGFGTVELGACDDNCTVIPESLDSITYGLHHVAPVFRDRLKLLGYERPEVKSHQFHFFDQILKDLYNDDPSFILRRHNADPLYRSDILPVANEVLEEYAENLIGHIRRYFTSFDYKIPVILTGGGTMYPVLVDRLTAFFERQAYEVHVADDQLSVLSAAIGYSSIAHDIFGEDSVGIDIGNNTVISIIKSPMIASKEKEKVKR